MDHYVIALTHRQVALSACIVGNGIKRIEELFADDDLQPARFDDYLSRRLCYLWGAIDAQLTLLADPVFRASLPGDNATVLNIEATEYMRYVASLSALRDSWYSPALANPTTGNNATVRLFWERLFPRFRQDWNDVFLPALPAGARPDGNETSKP